VNAIQVTAGSVQVNVSGFGTVEARTQVRLVPEVSGKVVAINPVLYDGGRFAKDDVLVTVDDQDYALALERAESGIAQAELQLDMELAEANVARREREDWAKRNPGRKIPALAVREQQVRMAKTGLKASEIDYARAELNLQRTRLSMPFDGRILDRQVDLGEFVTAGQPIATVYATSVMQIPMALEDFKLGLLDLDGDESVAVTVSTQFAGQSQQWLGRVVGTRGMVDRNTRLATVLVEVEQGALPLTQQLLPGMFVNVDIHGRVLESVYSIPRNSVRNEDTVWVVNEGKLSIRSVTVAHQDKHYAYISQGLDEGDVVVTSLLGSVVPQMSVRVHLEVLEERFAGSRSNKQGTAEL